VKFAWQKHIDETSLALERKKYSTTVITLIVALITAGPRRRQVPVRQ
jgi:hypothetical protein